MRFYRDSLAKMTECVDLMNREKVTFLVQLGDFKDQDAPPEEEKTLSYLRAIDETFSGFDGPRYHVLGNHDMDSISKAHFLENVTNSDIPRDRSYYSFDKNGVHFIVLDANYKSDGTDYDHGNFDWTDANIPAEQVEWLKRDLSLAETPAIVFIHQLLDEDAGPYCVKNAAEVRNVLKSSGRVLAVFQGHHHVGRYGRVDGIHYHTLKAMVEGQGAENNAYAIVTIGPAGHLQITGYRQAESRRLSCDHR